MVCDIAQQMKFYIKNFSSKFFQQRKAGSSIELFMEKLLGRICNSVCDIGSNAWKYDKWIYEKLINASIKRAYSDRDVARIPTNI